MEPFHISPASQSLEGIRNSLRKYATNISIIPARKKTPKILLTGNDDRSQNDEDTVLQLFELHSSILFVHGQSELGGDENYVSTKTFSTPARRKSNAQYNFGMSSKGTR